MSAPLYACVEAGGTKFVAGLVRGDGTIVDTQRIPTTRPDETIGATIAFFERMVAAHGPARAAGIASFGPVDLHPASPRWGHVCDTPKPGWSGADIAGPIGRALSCPVGFDTDVNGAVLAESLWGAAQGCDIAIYVTVGTGIGGGATVGGRPLHGARHPEMGHMLPRRHPDDFNFPGICPFHGDCVEGLASGPAIIARWGQSLSDLPADHPGHAIIASYLAQLVVAQQALLSPRRIILGGGVMQTPGLIGAVRSQAQALAAGYFEGPPVDALIVPPGLGTDAGLLGALALAQAAEQ